VEKTSWPRETSLHQKDVPGKKEKESGVTTGARTQGVQFRYNGGEALMPAGKRAVAGCLQNLDRKGSIPNENLN